jgi:hypothetical protein
MPRRTKAQLEQQLADLILLITEIQWVQPTYNGSRSCSGCGAMHHWGCSPDCPVAAITQDRGAKEDK